MTTPRMRTGLFFGSFNPVHIGHMAIANYFLAYTDLEEIWFILSPQNPHKKRGGLLDARLRLEMLHLAIDGTPGFRASDIELYLPQPSYTSITLVHLAERYPNHDFVLMMGSDTLLTLPRWFNPEAIIDHYDLYVFPRKGTESATLPGARVTTVDAPLMEISSSFIRHALEERRAIPYFLPPKVYLFIDKEQLYR